MRYTLHHWKGLTLFLEDGRIEVDTNTVDRGIRNVAQGRRSSLFAGSEEGAQTWAIMASLLQTARLGGLDPYTWPAVAAGPRVIDPDVSIKSILREYTQSARSAPARRTMLKRYNRVCIELAEKPEAYAPIYMRTEDGEVLLEDFANGFFTAMHLDMDAWKPFIADPEFGYPLTALLVHSTVTGGLSWIE